MNLVRCHALGFGKLKDSSFSFQPGLNVVFAPNEGGKSTLQRFLVALLYGQLRPDLRSQRRLESWVESCRPWHGTEYGGTLWCSLAGGRELELRRAFGKDEARIEIRTSTGEEITLSYEHQRNGEVLFARSHLGLPKEVFESVAVIRENRVAELNGRDTLRDRIANLAQSGDEEQSVQRTLGILEAAQESIGSERAPTKPYKRALDSIEALHAEKKSYEMRRDEFEDWLEERNRLAAEIQREERRLQQSRSMLMMARWREAAEKVRMLEDLAAEIRGLREQIETSDVRADFPAQDLEALEQLIGARESVARRGEDIARDVQSAASGLQNAEADRAALAPYAALAEAVETEKITEWFVKYMGTTFHRDEALRSLNAAREEILSLEEKVGKLGPALVDPSVDWERRAREAAEKERTNSEQIALAAQKLSELKDRVRGFERRAAGWRAAAIIALLAAGGAAAAWKFLGAELLPTVPALAFAAVLAVLAVIFLCLALITGAGAKPLRRQSKALETEKEHWRDESVTISREIRQAMESCGFKTVEEFLDAAREAGQWRQQLQQLRNRMKEFDEQHGKAAAESAENYAHLQETLAKVGLQCSPGTVKSKVDIVRANLRRFREMDEILRSCRRQMEDLQAGATANAREAEDNTAAVRAILEKAGVASPDAFRGACRERQRLVELTEKAALREREFQRLCGKLKLEEWREQLRELAHWKERARELGVEEGAPPDAGTPAPEMPMLPYQPGVAEAEAEEKRIASAIAAKREKQARVAERVSQAFLNFRPMSEIDEDLTQAEQSLEALSRNSEALELALETLKALAREQQEVLAPQLNEAVERRFLRLCQGRYQEVKIDPDFQVWVRESANGELRAAEVLSRGTQDQLYFSLRFGILDLLAESSEPCPALLDEPFAAYDHNRLRQAFTILQDEAQRRQLILFTCRDDLRDLGLTYGANTISMTNDE